MTPHNRHYEGLKANLYTAHLVDECPHELFMYPIIDMFIRFQCRLCCGMVTAEVTAVGGMSWEDMPHQVALCVDGEYIGRMQDVMI